MILDHMACQNPCWCSNNCLFFSLLGSFLSVFVWRVLRVSTTQDGGRGQWGTSGRTEHGASGSSIQQLPNMDACPIYTRSKAIQSFCRFGSQARTARPAPCESPARVEKTRRSTLHGTNGCHHGCRHQQVAENWHHNTTHCWCSQGYNAAVVHGAAVWSQLTSMWCRPLWTRTLTHDATTFLQYRMHSAHTLHLFLYFSTVCTPPPLLKLYVTPCTS